MLNSLGGKGWCICAKMQYAFKLSTVTAKELKTDLIENTRFMCFAYLSEGLSLCLDQFDPRLTQLFGIGGGAAGRVTYFA